MNSKMKLDNSQKILIGIFVVLLITSYFFLVPEEIDSSQVEISTENLSLDEAKRAEEAYRKKMSEHSQNIQNDKTQQAEKASLLNDLKPKKTNGVEIKRREIGTNREPKSVQGEVEVPRPEVSLDSSDHLEMKETKTTQKIDYETLKQLVLKKMKCDINGNNVHSSIWNLMVKKTGRDFYISKGNEDLETISTSVFGDGNCWVKLWSLNPTISDPYKLEKGRKIVFLPN